MPEGPVRSSHRRRGLGLLAAVAALTLLPAIVLGADDGAADHAADVAQLRQIVEKMRGTDRERADGGTERLVGMPALSGADLRFLGLRPGTGACAGAYERADRTLGDSCTHGLDVPMDEAAAMELAACNPDQDITTCPPPPGWALPTRIPCYTAGPFVDVLYLYWGTSQFDAAKEQIRRSVASVDKLFDISARSASGTDYVRHVRWRMDASCKLKVTPVQVPSSVNPGDIFGIKDNLINRGIIKSSAKYLGYIDEPGCGGGIAELTNDTRASQANYSNQGGTLGLTFGCLEGYHPYAGFGATIAAHELMHTLGAVNPNTPHTTGGHCWDDDADAHKGGDTMCYDDGYPGTFTQFCSTTYPETFDCRKDDYYNPLPASGSFLTRYWNAARNQFLAMAEPAKWDNLAKPTVTFVKPPVGGTVGGSNPAVIAVDDRGIGVESVAWSVNGAPAFGNDTTLQLDTVKSAEGGYSNGIELTIGATVKDRGMFTTAVTRKAVVANPTIRLVTPAATSVLSGPFSWSASALAVSGKTVTKVQLVVDDKVVMTDTTSPYGGIYDPQIPAAGGDMYIGIAARVTDSAGIVRTTPYRYLARPAPTIKWRAPSEYNPVDFPFDAPAGSIVKFTVDASTLAPGGVHRVLFRENGVTVAAATDYAAPYTFDYTVPAAGATKLISARAVDTKGVYSTTEDIAVRSITPLSAVTFTAPANDVTTFSGMATFSLSGATAYDAACLFIDVQYGPCIDPEFESSVQVDMATLTKGAHVAHWQLQWTAGSDFRTAEGPARRFLVGGTSPTIAITQLTPGLRVTAKKTVGAIVSGVPSGVFVNQVSFYEGTELIGDDWNAAYYLTWDPRFQGDGSRTIRAVASLSDGTFVRAQVDVVVANFSARITAPVPGAHVDAGTTISLLATGTADSETVLETATFYLDGVVIARDRAASFNVPWNTGATTGTHTLTMRMLLNDGRTLTTPPQTLTIDP